MTFLLEYKTKSKSEFRLIFTQVQTLIILAFCHNRALWLAVTALHILSMQLMHQLCEVWSFRTAAAFSQV